MRTQNVLGDKGRWIGGLTAYPRRGLSSLSEAQNCIAPLYIHCSCPVSEAPPPPASSFQFFMTELFCVVLVGCIDTQLVDQADDQLYVIIEECV